MGVLTVQLVLAVLPATILRDIGTLLRIVEKLVGWPSEVLLAVGVVALAPVVDRRVVDRAKGTLEAIEHELLRTEHFLQLF